MNTLSVVAVLVLPLLLHWLLGKLQATDTEIGRRLRASERAAYDMAVEDKQRELCQLSAARARSRHPRQYDWQVETKRQEIDEMQRWAAEKGIIE